MLNIVDNDSPMIASLVSSFLLFFLPRPASGAGGKKKEYIGYQWDKPLSLKILNKPESLSSGLSAVLFIIL